MYKPKSVVSSIAGLLFIALLTWATPAAAVDSPGVWKLTGSMTTSRRHSQRETLPDGRILVVGGTNTTGVDGSASVFHATTELYDPVTGTWTTTGSLTTGGRALHTSSRLPDGRILITGGWNGSAALSSAEIYDPATGTWTATGSMTTARAQHRDQILFDGRILITGGFDSAGTPLASAEIYNPATGTFTATGSMSTARSGHRTNLAGAGKVLVTGGFGAGGTPLTSAELFDPAAGTFSAAASLAQGRGHHFATELPTGEVLVSGGLGAAGVLNSSELYDPDTNTFAAGGTLNQARQNHSSQLLPNGLVIISGGNTTSLAHWDVQTNFLSSAELYDRATNTFTPTGSKINATSSSGSTIVLWTGKFLAAGGGTNAAELYTPGMPGTPEAWVATANMGAARTSHQQNLLDDGKVLLSGGLDAAGNPLASAALYE
jgi:WD40 repeat protein